MVRVAKEPAAAALVQHNTAVCAERESGIVEVAMDYIQIEIAVPASAEDNAAEADETAEQTKTGTETHKKRVLVGRDRCTKAVFSLLVQCKII